MRGGAPHLKQRGSQASLQPRLQSLDGFCRRELQVLVNVVEELQLQ